MSSKEGRHGLEAEEERLLTARALQEDRQIELEELLHGLEAKLEKSRDSVRILEENRRTMKNEAPVVSLRRFNETKQALGHHQYAVAHFQKELSIAQAQSRGVIAELAAINALLRELAQRRAAHGRILPFRRPVHD